MADNSKETPLDFNAMKVVALKALLKKKGLPVSGKKAELVERLRTPPSGPKPKAWQYSDAKKALKKDLHDPKSPIHDMSAEAVKSSDPRYEQYPNFEKYYEDLKEKVKAEKILIEADDLAAKMHVMSFPKEYLNERGYPHWDVMGRPPHPAKALLEVDVMNGLHRIKTPKELQKTRREYKEFPRNVFAKKVQKEASKQKLNSFWADKRNKKGMKRYLKDVERRAAGGVN